MARVLAEEERPLSVVSNAVVGNRADVLDVSAAEADTAQRPSLGVGDVALPHLIANGPAAPANSLTEPSPWLRP